MKKYLLIAAVAAGAWWLWKKKYCKTSDEISLANIRRGIKNGWYSAELLDMDNKLYIQLTGTRTDGSQEQSVYEISRETFDALKNDGVKQIV